MYETFVYTSDIDRIYGNYKSIQYIDRIPIVGNLTSDGGYKITYVDYSLGILEVVIEKIKY